MKTIKIEKTLALQDYITWKENELPMFARVDKVRGTRFWEWNSEDLENAQEHYRSKFYEYVKIKWV